MYSQVITYQLILLSADMLCLKLIVLNGIHALTGTTKNEDSFTLFYMTGLVMYKIR